MLILVLVMMCSCTPQVENEFTQTTGIISQQAEDSMKNGCGVAFYAYNNVFYNSEVDEKRMQEEMEYIKNSLNCM